MEENREFQWKSIIWSAILMFVIPLIVQMLIPTIYATYTGFQTRGDAEAINQAVMAVSTSPIFFVVIYLVSAAVALWRGLVLTGKAEYRPNLHALIAGGLAIAVPVILNVMSSGIVLAVLLIVVTLGSAYLGVMLGKRQAKKTE